MAAHPVDIYAGQRLKLRRTILAMSQEALARSVGITFQQVQKYERGVNRMGASRLWDFSQALGVEVSFFFEGYVEQAVGSRHAGRVADSGEDGFEHEKLPTRDTLEFARLFTSLPDSRQRKAIVEMMKALKPARAS